jgi:phthalate 4,5-dioxygenase
VAPSPTNETIDQRIDCDAQRNDVIFTGVSRICRQDQEITDSVSPIVDHHFEYLMPSDRMITRTRGRLSRDRGTMPRGVDTPEVYAHAHRRGPTAEG